MGIIKLTPSYLFIVIDYEISEIINSKGKIITVQEAIDLGIKAHELKPWEKMTPNAKILFFENESDLGELFIKKKNIFEETVRWYTDKPFIYSVHFGYSV